MELFIDSADIEEIESVLSCGILDGVTTNPSLIKKAFDKYNKPHDPLDIEKYIKKIIKVCKKIPVSLEVSGSTYLEMVHEGEILYKKFNNVGNDVVIKIPVNPSFDGKKNNYDGIKAIKELTKKKIPVNCTLVFTPEQALLAAKAGARYVSPFVGREDDYVRKTGGKNFDKKEYFSPEGIEGVEDEGIKSGIDLVGQIVSMFRYHGIETKVLAASIRNKRQFREAALVGADIATVPFSIVKELLNHEKTKEGMGLFKEDTVKEYSNLMES